jgi:hypothetical protein
MAAMTAHAGPAAGPGTGPVRLPALAWVVWRQHRAALAGLLLLAGAGAAIAIVTGLPMHSVYDRYVQAHCLSPGAACGDLMNQFANYKEGPVPIALHVFPILIGMFLGAPLLAREIESGTFRFAWTQEVGRTRWLLAKLLMLGLVVIGASLVVGALGGWWLHPFDVIGVSSRWQGGEFDVAPLVLAGWCLLAFATGVLAGALLRRTVPAMAATAVAVTVVLGLFWFKLDNLLLSVAPRSAAANPFYAAGALTSPGPSAINGWAPGNSGLTSGGWLVRGWYTQSGHPMTAAAYERVTNVLYGGDRNLPNPMRWLAAHHDVFQVAYQPGGRFWVFQTATAAALFLLALALATAAVALVRRRGA